MERKTNLSASKAYRIPAIIMIVMGLVYFSGQVRKVLAGMDFLDRYLCPYAFYYGLLFEKGSRPFIETNEG